MDRTAWWLRTVRWVTIFIGLTRAATAQPAGALRTIEGGWFELPPYAFRGRHGGVSGFDIAMLHEIGRRASIKFSIREIGWLRTQELMSEGRLDFGLAAFRTPEREAYARFSRPYRQEKDRLFLRPDLVATVRARTPGDLFPEIHQKGLKIGVVQGYNYGPQASTFLTNPKNQANLVYSLSDTESVRRMIAGEIDGFLADRLSGYEAMAAAGNGAIATPLPIAVFDADVHVMFTRATVPPELVQRFDVALASVLADGTYDRIHKRFVLPTLLDIAVASDWFWVLDCVGTVAFAISGVLLAPREKYSLFGALVLASLPALGGGVLRDLLVGRNPIGILDSPVGLLLVLFTVVTGYTLFRLYDFLQGRYPFMMDLAWMFIWIRRYLPPRSIYEVSDAVGLAAFTVTGVVIAIRFSADPLWIWGPLLATLTAAGGGILRDVLRSDTDIAALKTSLYAEIALIWGLLLSLVATTAQVDTGPALFQFAVAVTVVGAFMSRMVVVLIRLPSPRF